MSFGWLIDTDLKDEHAKTPNISKQSIKTLKNVETEIFFTAGPLTSILKKSFINSHGGTSHCGKYKKQKEVGNAASLLQLSLIQLKEQNLLHNKHNAKKVHFYLSQCIHWEYMMNPRKVGLPEPNECWHLKNKTRARVLGMRESSRNLRSLCIM